MKISEWLSLFREHPEKHLFSTSDLFQLTELRKEVLQVELARLVRSGTVERIARGWYSNPFHPPTPEETAMVLRHPSYISMEYALSFHNILSQTTYTMTLITIRSPYTYNQGKWAFEYHQIANRLFWGFEKKDTFYMAGPEKAFLDLIYIRTVRNKEIDTEGIYSFLDDMYLDDLDKNTIRTYAKRFGGNTRRVTDMLLSTEFAK